MNMSDGFGIHVSPTPSPVKGIGEDNASVDSQRQQQQRQQQQQEANLWGNLTCAIKNTAQYASHEFDRFIDAIGFKQSDTETSNSTRQIQLDKVCIIILKMTRFWWMNVRRQRNQHQQWSQDEHHQQWALWINMNQQHRLWYKAGPLPRSLQEHHQLRILDPCPKLVLLLQWIPPNGNGFWTWNLNLITCWVMRISNPVAIIMSDIPMDLDIGTTIATLSQQSPMLPPSPALPRSLVTMMRMSEWIVWKDPSNVFKHRYDGDDDDKWRQLHDDDLLMRYYIDAWNDISTPYPTSSST